jgi:hypothetical protein
VTALILVTAWANRLLGSSLDATRTRIFEASQLVVCFSEIVVVIVSRVVRTV